MAKETKGSGDMGFLNKFDFFSWIGCLQQRSLERKLKTPLLSNTVYRDIATTYHEGSQVNSLPTTPGQGKVAYNSSFQDTEIFFWAGILDCHSRSNLRSIGHFLVALCFILNRVRVRDR